MSETRIASSHELESISLFLHQSIPAVHAQLLVHTRPREPLVYALFQNVANKLFFCLLFNYPSLPRQHL